MSLLTTTCARCGEIELPVERVVLRIDESDRSGSCVIRCPECGDRFLKEANRAMIAMLLAVGIEVSHWPAAPHGVGLDELLDGPGAITSTELDHFRERLGGESRLLQYLEVTD